MASDEIKDDDALEALVPIDKVTKEGFFADALRREIEITKDNISDWTLLSDPWVKNMHGITGIEIQRDEQVYPAAVANDIPFFKLLTNDRFSFIRRQIADVPIQFVYPCRLDPTRSGDRGDVQISICRECTDCKDDSCEECKLYFESICYLDRKLQPGDVVVVYGVNIYKMSSILTQVQWTPALPSDSDPSPIPMPSFMNEGKPMFLSFEMARKVGIVE